MGPAHPSMDSTRLIRLRSDHRRLAALLLYFAPNQIKHHLGRNEVLKRAYEELIPVFVRSLQSFQEPHGRGADRDRSQGLSFSGHGL